MGSAHATTHHDTPFRPEGAAAARPFRTSPRVRNVDEIASFCGVPAALVRRWIDAGLLGTTPMRDGYARVTAADFSAFLGRSDTLNPRRGSGTSR